MNGELQSIPPLSDEAWLRIEANVYSELQRGGARVEPIRPRMRPLPLAGLAAAAALALGLGWVLVPSGSVSPVASAERGSTQAVPGGHVSSRYITTGRDPEVLEFEDATIDMAPHSAVLAFSPTAPGPRVVLEKGAAYFKVDSQPQGRDFVVQAGNVRVRVIGTEFSVARMGTGARVEVSEGIVEVTHRDEVHRLTVGERLTKGVALTPDEEPEPDWEAVEEEDDSDEKSSMRPRRRASARQLFQRATALESNSPKRAARLYRMASRGHGSWAANALYAMAMLALDEGEPARANRYLEEYLRRFPKGVNAVDARRELLRVSK